MAENNKLNSNVKTVATLKKYYEDLNDAAKAYLTYKEENLKATFAKGKRDERGEIRFNTVSSLLSVISPEQIEGVCLNYNEYVRYETQIEKAKTIHKNFREEMKKIGFEGGIFNKKKIPQESDIRRGEFLYKWLKAAKDMYSNYEVTKKELGNNHAYYVASLGDDFNEVFKAIEFAEKKQNMKEIEVYVNSFNLNKPENEQIDLDELKSFVYDEANRVELEMLNSGNECRKIQKTKGNILPEDSKTKSNVEINMTL